MTPRSTGLVFALTAVCIFAIQDGISKHLGTAYPPIFVTMIRYWAFAGFAIAVLLGSAGTATTGLVPKGLVLMICAAAGKPVVASTTARSGNNFLNIRLILMIAHDGGDEVCNTGN